MRRSVSRYAYDGLDRVIHERARLSVMTSLITHPKGLSFNQVKALCGLTDGNLSRHLQVLVESKLVTLSRISEQSRKQTSCRVTALGRKKYLDYLAVLAQVLDDANARDAGAIGDRTPVARPLG